MAKMDLAKVRATMVNIMRSCVCGDVVDKMKNDFSVILFASLSVGPCPPKVLQYESWSTPIWHLRPHPKNDTPKQNIYFRKENNEKKTAKLAQEGCLGRCQLEPQKAGWHFPEVLQ